MQLNNLKMESDLSVTAEGIMWANGRIRFPWGALANIEVGNYNVPRGKQRSSFGIGPIGVAVVAATTVSNARSRQVIEYRLTRLTA